MTSQELMNALFAWCMDGAPHDYSTSVDTLKCGNPDVAVKKVAVAMFATPNLIREVTEWGAGLLIVHEPTFYNHRDIHLKNDPVTLAKGKMLQECGLTVWRYHDHPHYKDIDMIDEGGVHYLGWHGTMCKGPEIAITRFCLDTPMTAREIARQYEQERHVAHVRVCGAMDKPLKRLSLCFGTPGKTFEELQNPEIDAVLIGEASEWQIAEYARDADQLGFVKSLLILGHIPSERDGMRFLTEKMQRTFPDIETRYFECGEVYSYAD